jgi:hypothetical protein
MPTVLFFQPEHNSMQSVLYYLPRFGLVAACCLLTVVSIDAQNPDSSKLRPLVRTDLQQKLKEAQKLKLSGIVLTTAGPVLEGAALVMIAIGGFGDKARTEPAPPPTKGQQRWNRALPPLFWFCGVGGPAAFLSGVPLLTTGLLRERRYKKMLAPVQLKTGWLPDGKIGLALNF